MKQVTKKDLKDLIEDFYCKIIANITLIEHYELPVRDQVVVNVNSVAIKVWWRFDKTIESEADTDSLVDVFGKALEELTFGNLKVVYSGIGKFDNKDIYEIYIANAYEVIK